MGPVLTRIRRRAGALAAKGFFQGLATVSRLHPKANPARHGVERISDVPYFPEHPVAHRLDIYRPALWTNEKRPVVLYIHGGGFHMLSKETHWLMGLIFARRGYVCFSINYRLAPKYPFPAAVEDASAALSWVVDNADCYGGDPSQLVLAGESAGANLATTLAIARSYPRPEPYARRIWDLNPSIKAIIPACGIFEVSRPERFDDLPVSRFARERITETSKLYLRGNQGDLTLANPLQLFEKMEQPDRPLPPFYIPVGGGDPLEDDARRMERALQQLEVPCRMKVYGKEMHAFHALIWREQARACWRDTFDFLAEQIPPPTPSFQEHFRG